MRLSTGCRIAKRVLKKGDIVSIDTGVKLDGYYGDSAITVPIGEVSEETQQAAPGDAGIAGTGHRSGAARQPAV